VAYLEEENEDAWNGSLFLQGETKSLKEAWARAPSGEGSALGQIQTLENKRTEWTS